MGSFTDFNEARVSSTPMRADRPAALPAGAWVVAAVASAYYAVFVARTAFSWDGRVGFTLFDDAMISMRYARHLAEGAGLVWNVGGERIEGYSNPLWMLFMAAVHAAGVSDLKASLVVATAGGLLVLLCAVLAAKLASELTSARGAALIALGLTAADFGLVYWSLRGMEVALLAACILGLILNALRHVEAPTWRRLAAICALGAAAMLTRRDAAVAVGVCGAFLWFRLDRRRRWPAAVALAATIAAAQGGQMAFSAWYFGDPWPNTYYLKLVGIPLTTRLGRGIPAAVLVTLRHIGPLLLLALPALARAELRPKVLLPVAVLVGQVGYSAYVGGDAWEYMVYANRYITIAVPALCVAAACGLTVVAGSVGTVRLIAWAVAALIAVRLAAESVLFQLGHLVERQGSMVIAFAAPALCTAIVLAIAVAFARRTWRPQPALVWLTLAVWITSSGVPTADWAARNAREVTVDGRSARLGLVVQRLTAEETVIAVTHAGNIPYFARRHTIDILGKSDRVIARMDPVQAFWPGHNKWDLERSIVGPRPDLIWGLPRAAGQVRFLVDLGYVPWTASLFALRSSARIPYDALQTAVTQIYPGERPRRLDE